MLARLPTLTRMKLLVYVPCSANWWLVSNEKDALELETTLI
jgi:hypothetical protein